MPGPRHFLLPGSEYPFILSGSLASAALHLKALGLKNYQNRNFTAIIEKIEHRRFFLTLLHPSCHPYEEVVLTCHSEI